MSRGACSTYRRSLPRRLGLPDYALLQSAVGATGSGAFGTPGAAAAAAAAAGLHGMGGMRGGGMPPLDPATLSQVNLAAGFGLGGLGNGEALGRCCYRLNRCRSCCVAVLAVS